MHELALPLLVGLIVVALAFDFLNGLHDAANSIATVVGDAAARARSRAVAFAAFFNFAAYFLALQWPALHKVADTIGKGLIDKDLVTPAVVFGALVGAMFWNVVTWLKGIPSSSSHALVGGLIGAGVAHAGHRGHPVGRAQQDADRDRPVADARADPDHGDHAARRSWLGFAPARAARSAPSAACTSSPPAPIRSATASTMRRRRWASSPCCSIRPAISTATFHVPHWVALSCYVAIGLGTLTGGWRIIETMGTRITKLSQHQGFSRFGRRVDHAVRGVLARHPGVDDAHHHRLRDRRGRRAPRLGGALGRGGQRDDRLGHHHPRLGGGRGAVLLADQRGFVALRDRGGRHRRPGFGGAGVAPPEVIRNPARAPGI